MREKLFFMCFYSRAESATERERERESVFHSRVDKFARIYMRSSSSCMVTSKLRGAVSEQVREKERNRGYMYVDIYKYTQMYVMHIYVYIDKYI